MLNRNSVFDTGTERISVISGIPAPKNPLQAGFYPTARKRNQTYPSQGTSRARQALTAIRCSTPRPSARQLSKKLSDAQASRRSREQDQSDRPLCAESVTDIDDPSLQRRITSALSQLGFASSDRANVKLIYPKSELRGTGDVLISYG